jgi:CrcB protein
LNYLSIAIGGAIGALLRYIVSDLAYSYFGETFPWGTLVVNVIGSFLIGFLWQLFDQLVISANTRVFLLTGVLGAFTTFSTFSLETFNLLRDGEVKLGVINVVVSTAAGLAAVFLGFVAARFLLGMGK